MELGALVCTPRNPQCRICPVKKLCVAFLEARIGELPNLGKRETITARRFIAFVVERNGRFLVRQRSAGVINAHLWEFPNAEIGVRLSSAAATSPAHDAEKFQTALATGPLRLGQPRSAAKAAQTFGLELQSAKPFCTVKHSITRYRITLEAFRVPLGETSYTSPHPKGAKSGTRKTRPSENNGVWLPLAKLDSLAFTSAHRRILRHLQTHPQ
jgi:A/G-specific adenine glycosylase